MAINRFKAWQAIHKWTSIVSTAFLLLLCLTGVPLIFKDELAAAPRTDAIPSARPAARRRLSLQEAVSEAQRSRPGERAQFVFWRQDADGLVGVGVGPIPDASLDQVHRLLIDLGTGQVMPEAPADSPFMETVARLHATLCAGDAGRAVLTIVASLFVLSMISGIALYGPFTGRLRFGTVRSEQSKRRLAWLDLHNLLGGATLAWALVVGMTGLINTLEPALFGAWESKQLSRLPDTASAASHGAHACSVDEAYAVARRTLPDMVPTSIGFPDTRFSNSHQFMIWMHGATPLGKRLFTPVLVDAASGALASREGLPWYLRALEVSRPLHFGDYAGVPLKAIWLAFTVLTIVILVSGLYLWLRGARASFRRTGGDGVDLHSMKVV